MKEEIKLFIQKVAADEELQKKMKDCKSPEEAYEIASSVQDGFTFEEFVDTMTKLQNAIEQNAELSDEELANAAGGQTDPTIIVISTISAGTITVSVAAAASM